MSATPIWLTLVIGLLGPIATVAAVVITARNSSRRLSVEQESMFKRLEMEQAAALRRLDLEEAAALRSEEREGERSLAAARLAFEVESLEKLSDSVQAAWQFAVDVNRQYKAGNGEIEEFLIQYRPDIERIIVGLEAAGRALDVAFGRSANELASAYRRAVVYSGDDDVIEKLTHAVRKGRELQNTIPARLRSLHTEPGTPRTLSTRRSEWS